MPYDYWIDRWHMSHIDYSLSFGFFDQSKLCGFILHGIDEWNSHQCFYNLATGVIPSHRGNRIVKSLYKEALPKLKKNKCTKGFLEVLTDNTKAIKSYESIGYSIIDELKSYKPKKNIRSEKQLEMKLNPEWHPDKYKEFSNHLLSFEHRDSIINRNPNAFEYYEFYDNKQLKAFAIKKISNNNILQFGFSDNNITDYAPSVFTTIANQDSSCKMINLSIKDTELISYFDSNEFEYLISQYSMQIII